MLTIFFVYSDDLEGIVVTTFTLTPHTVPSRDRAEFAHLPEIELPPTRHST